MYSPCRIYHEGNEHRNMVLTSIQIQKKGYAVRFKVFWSGILLLFLFSCAVTQKQNRPENPDSTNQHQTAASAADSGKANTGSGIRLTDTQLIALALQKLPDDKVPVYKNQTPFCYITKMKEKSDKGIMLLTVQDNSGIEKISWSMLSRKNRIYSGDSRSFSYYLAIFSTNTGPPMLLKELYINNAVVIDTYMLLPIHKAGNPPFLIICAFPEETNQTEILISITENYYTDQLSFKNDLTANVLITDINNDNFLDIIKHITISEEGLGSETYKKLYNWQDTAYINTRTVNIVRNLNSFIENIENAISSRNWSKLLMYTQKNKAAKEDPEKALKPFIAGESVNTPAFGESYEISSTVFPRFSENPFRGSAPDGDTLPLVFRVLTDKGLQYFYKIHIKLSANPFSDPQYYLVPVR